VRRAALLLLAGAGLAIAACGGERGFDAEAIVEEMNAKGAELAVGEELPSTEAGVEVRVIEVGGAEPSPSGETAAGTVVVLDDAEAASAEFGRCQAAISFVCFRAANTVLRFTNLDRAQQEQLSAALREIEAGSG
jgi:hypothetical protein